MSPLGWGFTGGIRRGQMRSYEASRGEFVEATGVMYCVFASTVILGISRM